jgi:predicted Zn-dependent peptidase
MRIWGKSQLGAAVSAAALLMAAAPGPVFAQGAPAAAQAAPIADLLRGVDIPYETFTLDNGLKVIVHQDHSNPIVTVSVWYNVGSKDEPAGRTGFAHLFEHLMFGGSENASGSYLNRMTAVGATSLNGTTWFDRTNYFETVPTPALETALYLESDRMGHMLGAISQETLDLQRGVVQNEKRQGDNQPFGLTEYALLENLFPEGHPYRHSTIGSMSDLDAAAMDDVREWFTENYGPNNAIVVLAGDIDTATARTLMNRYFGPIPRGPVNTPAEAPVPVLAAPIEQTMHDRVPYVSIQRYWPTPGLLSDDATELEVAASVLGGLASSRLDNELVRGDQTAVSVSASYNAFHRIGWFDVTVNVKPGGDAAAVRARADQIIADFIAQGPSDEEIQRVATQTIASRITRLEQLNGRASTLAEGQLYAGDPEHYRKELRELAAVTPDDVRGVMNTWLTRPSYNLTVEPGEREAYAEAAATPAGARPSAPPSNYQPTPRGPIPTIGEVAGLNFPDISRARLSNGVEVIATQSARVPSTRVSVEFDAGWAADSADALGVEALMLRAMTEGADGMDANELAQERERLGASVNAGASMDRTTVNLTALTANLGPSLDLLADVVRRPDFEPAVIQRLQAQQLASIRAERSSPSGLGMRAFYETLYDGAYGRGPSGLGDPAAVSAADRDQLTAFHDAWIRPDNARIYVVSDRPISEILPQLEARFGDWSPPSAARGEKAPVAVDAVQPRIILIDRPQSPQSLILGGEVLDLAGADDRLVVGQGVDVLGTSFLSRINADLRETKGWSYGARSMISGLEGRSPYMINAPVQADRTGESIAALISIHQAFLGDQGVTEEELARTRDGATRRLAGQFETSNAVLGALQSNQLFGRSDDYWEQAGARYRGMTAQALDQSVRALVDPSKFVWVVVGDASVVRPQLEALGLPVEVRAAE